MGSPLPKRYELNPKSLTVERSPYGLTITPRGIAISFCKVLVLGILSVVTLMRDLSVLRSSNECCSTG
jgi:hypothetical protein